MRQGAVQVSLQRKVVARQVGPALEAVLESRCYPRSSGKALEDFKQVRDVFLNCILKRKSFWLLCGKWMRGGMEMWLEL